jgi:hypothetical protein
VCSKEATESKQCGSNQQKLAIACKRLEYAEKKEEQCSMYIEKHFAIEHWCIIVQQPQMADQHQQMLLLSISKWLWRISL